MQVLIIDDDPMMRRAVTRLCQKHPKIKETEAVDSAEAGLAVLLEKEFDVLLLDVELPKMSGFEMLKKLPIMPALVCMTSKAEYAFDAFEYQALDFLKKPITPSRFILAIDKVVNYLQKETPPQSQSARVSDDLYVKESGKFYRINPESILYFENVGDYVKVKTEKGSHIIHSTLKGLAERLTDRRFLKVHRSFIVNMDKIVDIEEGSLVIDRKVIPVSRAHRADLIGRLRVL